MGSTTIGIDLGGTKALMLCGETEARLDTGPAFSPEALKQRLRAFASGLDELAGGSFIAAGLGISSVDLARRATEGDASALEAIRKGGFALGTGLAAVIHLLNPSRLAVGGGALSLPGYWEAARDATARHSIPEMSHACRLYQVRAGARVAALGAIRLASA